MANVRRGNHRTYYSYKALTSVEDQDNTWSEGLGDYQDCGCRGTMMLTCAEDYDYEKLSLHTMDPHSMI
jgi:hypothetical protein